MLPLSQPYKDNNPNIQYYIAGFIQFYCITLFRVYNKVSDRFFM